MIKNLLLLLICCLCQTTSFSQNVTGSYQHTISRVMGGYRIAATTNLEISKKDNQSLSFNITTTTVDEYSGGVPKTEKTSGTLKLINNKYRFIGGSYGERGAYISSLSASGIIVNFAPNRGNLMSFERQ